MGFLSKEELHKEATRLGIETEGVKFQVLQGLVTKAKAAEGTSTVTRGKVASKPVTSQFIQPEIAAQTPARTPAPQAKQQPQVTPVVVQAKHQQKAKPDPLRQYANKTILIAPEMAPTKTQLIKYNEELGEEIIVEEVQHELGQIQQNLETGTYRIKDKTGQKIIAQSTLPKQNAGIFFRPGTDIVPRVRFNRREGYLWTHQRLPNIKSLLVESGYYEKYKDRFQDEPAIWYSAGKLLTCDIGLVHSIFQEIQDDVKRRRQGY